MFSPVYDQILLEAFDAITMRCTRLVSTPELANRNPLIVADLFGLCRKYLNQNKPLFFRSSSLEAILTMLMRTIGIHHIEASENHTLF